jgi:hypothetical protein
VGFFEEGRVNLLAIDPGRQAGWALFKSRKLAGAGVWQSNIVPKGKGLLDLVVVEAPRWYPREHRIDVNDLLDLSIAVGKIEGMMEERGVPVEIVYPRTWKGSVPKEIHNRRVLAALTPQELGLLPKRPRARDFDHNVIDAVGIGLWKLGRM